MPELAEPPANLSPTTSANLHAAALSGRSFLETAAAKPAPAAPTNNQPSPAPATDEPAPSLSDGLLAAQNKDRGIAPATDAPAAPPAKRADVPRIPGATDAPASITASDEYRPKGKKDAEHWDALRSEAAAAKAEVARIRAEQAKSDPSEIEDLRKQLETYQQELRDVAIERDPAFKQRYEPRRNAAIETAKLAAGDNGEKLAKLLSHPPSEIRDSQIEKLMEDLPASAQRRINAALGVIEGLDVERETEIAANRQTYDARTKQAEQQNRARAQQQQQQITKAFKAEVEAWKDPEKGSPFLREIPGNEEHNAAVRDRIQQAENLFGGKATPEALSNAVLWAVSGPAILEAAQSAIAERDQYKALVERMRGTTPGAGRDGGPSGGEDAPAPGSPGYSGHFQSGLAAAQQADRGRA